MSDMNDRPSDSMKKKTGIFIAILLTVTAAAITAGIVIYAVPVVKTINRKITGITEEIDIGDRIIDAGDGINVGNVKVGTDGIEINVGNGKDGKNTETGNIVKSGKTGSWDPDANQSLDRISVEADLINLHVVSGDAFHAEWDVADSFSDVEIRTEGNELKIRKKGGESFNIRLGADWNLDELKSDLTLTVPEGVLLEELEIEVDCGNIVVKGVKSRKTEIDAACGNIELRGADLGDLEVEADCGNIDLEEVTASNATLQADLGRVAVLEGNTEKLYVKADCGQIDCRRIKADRVELDADCGSIDVSGDFGSLKADCDLGSITVDTDRPESEVSLDLHTSVGSVTVNGKNR